MSHAHHYVAPSLPPVVTPWALRAWPQILWQAHARLPSRFKHIGTRIIFSGDPLYPPAGQTLWAARAGDGDAGVAWDWVEIASGVVAIADPMSVVTNLRLVGAEGGVLTAHQSALFLNELVHTLPWQTEVQSALRRCND